MINKIYYIGSITFEVKSLFLWTMPNYFAFQNYVYHVFFKSIKKLKMI